MPFELGLAVSPGRDRAHEWFVFEEQRHRLKKSLSDLNGTDPHIHAMQPGSQRQRVQKDTASAPPV
ncbi:MAG: hypothetical protein ACRELZ_03545 [Candidatus Rokuibacteriota bacterium]